MADRVKMSRSDRAKQFSPFDALKGLQETIKIKEYEHERIICGEMSEDEIKEISAVILSLEKGDKVQIEFFRDGHIWNLTGLVKLDVFNQKMNVGAFEISFDEIRKLKKI
jgi:hypothetical protein